MSCSRPGRRSVRSRPWGRLWRDNAWVAEGVKPAAVGVGRAWRRAFAVAALVVAAGLWVCGFVLAGLNGDPQSAASGVGPVALAVVGALILWQRPQNRLGWVFVSAAVAGTVLGAGSEYASRALVHAPGSLPGGGFVGWLADFMAHPVIGLLAGMLPQLFPTGRPLSSRWRWPVWAAVGFMVFGSVGNGFVPQHLESVPSEPNPYAIASARGLFGALIVASVICGLVALVGSVASLIVRWRRSRGDERQQLKWFLAGVVLLPIPIALHGDSNTASDAGLSVLFVVIPATMGVAILRYRLYDLDLVVRRAIVYLLVSALVAAGYLGIVAAAEAAVSGTVGLGVHVLAAVVAAAGFQPLRSRVQRGVDRLFYGDRSRPYDVLARLGRHLEAVLLPEAVLPGVVDAVADALRLRYVAIEFADGEAWSPAAQHGQLHDDPDSFPMTYQGELVGRMLVCSRGRGETLTDGDRRLLADLARQAGVAAHAVRSAAALARSRAELVTAREEERRRLRRDLHDGLGPTLAGVTMGLHAAATRIGTDPGEATRLLASLETQVEQAVADIRRLVYGLRPPALDEFGLIRAVQLHAAQFDGGGDLAVTVDSPAEGLGQLPAAVEVAAYRIATEALTNVARHSSASSCTVRLGLNGALEVEVVDDGHGLPSGHRAGVGLTAMRERAAELGGTLCTHSGPAGTRIVACLPVVEAT